MPAYFRVFETLNETVILGFGSNEFSEKSLKMYPNPITKNIFHIDLSGQKTTSKDLTIELVSISGQLIDKQVLPAADTINYQFDSGIKNSIYVIKVYADDFNVIERVSLQR